MINKPEQYIAYVMVHDSGDYWAVDNFMTDATGIVTPIPTVPEPTTFVIWLALGTIGIVLSSRHRGA